MSIWLHQIIFNTTSIQMSLPSQYIISVYRHQQSTVALANRTEVKTFHCPTEQERSFVSQPFVSNRASFDWQVWRYRISWPSIIISKKNKKYLINDGMDIRFWFCFLFLNRLSIDGNITNDIAGVMSFKDEKNRWRT